MNISEELKEKINILFKNNEEVRNKLLAGDVNTISEIGEISQKGINPEEIVNAYKSNDSASMETIYDKAQKLIELQKLYKELYIEYYTQAKRETEIR